jgi:hypothetical protein
MIPGFDSSLLGGQGNDKNSQVRSLEQLTVGGACAWAWGVLLSSWQLQAYDSAGPCKTHQCMYEFGAHPGGSGVLLAACLLCVRLVSSFPCSLWCQTPGMKHHPGC